MSVPDAVKDLALADIATSTLLSICSAEPANYAGIAAVSLGSKALTAGNGNGDWIIADGDVSGRKVSMTGQTGIEPTGSGNVLFYAFSVGTTLKATSPVTSQAVELGQVWMAPAIKVWEIRDPSYS